MNGEMDYALDVIQNLLIQYVSLPDGTVYHSNMQAGEDAVALLQKHGRLDPAGQIFTKQV